MEDRYMQMIIEATQSVKSAHHRIDRMEEDIGEIKELTIAVKEIAMETRANREDVNKISERLETIEQKPVKNLLKGEIESKFHFFQFFKESFYYRYHKK